MKIGVIGAGAWGLALSQVLCDNGHDVLVYALEKERLDEINTTHTARAVFGDHVMPECLRATGDFALAATDKDAILLSVPTHALDEVLEKLLPYLSEQTLIINTAKGFDRKNRMLPCEAMAKVLGDRKTPPISVLGPSHAEEVIVRKLTCICAVCEDLALSRRVQEMFSNEYLRLYTCTDPRGAEVGAAAKNVIAIAAGMLDGMGTGGDNSKAALVSRGICEILRYGMQKGAQADTFFGLTGVGDLIVTCFSIHSRNYRAGLQIGRADGAAEFLETNRETVEGVFSCRVIAEQARALGVDMPLVEAVYAVLFEGCKPSEVVRSVMLRPLKDESAGRA